MSPSRRTLVGAALALPAALAEAAPLPPGAKPGPVPRRRSAGLLFGKGDKLVIIGDSITDAGRKEAGEGLFEAIGRGYVAQIDGLLGAIYPERAIRVINKGTSGHTTRDLKARWQKDVLDLHPQWVACMIGTNDVWRQFDVPRMPEQAVPIDEYERNLGELVAQTRPTVKGLVLMTPFFLEPNRADPMRAQMDRYGAVVKKLAAANDAILVDTQAAFDRLLQHLYPATIAWDRVHPNHIGTTVLAKAFLDAVGFSWNP
jgi:lysophospholipase L1-like esterase